MKIEELYVGRYVHYQPTVGDPENGRVKSIIDDNVFVVYKCGDNWNHFEDYTGQNTPVENLFSGWVAKK